MGTDVIVKLAIKRSFKFVDFEEPAAGLSDPKVVSAEVALGMVDILGNDIDGGWVDMSFIDLSVLEVLSFLKFVKLKPPFVVFLAAEVHWGVIDFLDSVIVDTDSIMELFLRGLLIPIVSVKFLEIAEPPLGVICVTRIFISVVS